MNSVSHSKAFFCMAEAMGMSNDKEEKDHWFFKP